MSLGEIRMVQGQPDMFRFLTRRAASLLGPEHAKGYPSIAGVLTGLRIEYAIVDCTLADIGDPHFRLWLSETLASRIVAGAIKPTISLEIHT